MAKNRNKSKKNASTAMNTDVSAIVSPQATAMDTSETVASAKSQISRVIAHFSKLSISLKKFKPTVIPRKVRFSTKRKVKKGVQMKRTKNVRKQKAKAKAVSQNEKSATKIQKNESKTLRTKSAKNLYD